MGRITVFSVPDCRECHLVKKAFRKRSIPFTEIDLKAYPGRRKDMVALSHQISVPQVFFNNEHIGGAAETLAVLAEWDNDIRFAGYETVKERYEIEIGSFGRDRIDKRLEAPKGHHHHHHHHHHRNSHVDGLNDEEEFDDEITFPDGSTASVRTITLQLVAYMPRDDLWHRARLYSNCFRGTDGVHALMRLYGIHSREAAVQFGQTLLRRGILHHITNDQTFKDERKYYRLQPFNESKVLNSFRVWNTSDDLKTHNTADPTKTLDGLVEMMDGIISSATDPETGLVDFLNFDMNSRFHAFEEAVCKLRIANVMKLREDPPVALAFYLNLYNLMVRHAFFKIGVPSSKNHGYYAKVSYNIGGFVLSLNDIEHGILRGNARQPHKFTSQFSSSDKRKVLILKKVDPRIHFALNCGARSCPPVYKYTAEAIDEELNVAAQVFCSKDANVSISEANRELFLPKVMKWYTGDFAPSVSDLPGIVIRYLVGERREKLRRMMMENKSIKVRFHPFDWSPNTIIMDTNHSRSAATQYQNIPFQSPSPRSHSSRKISVPFQSPEHFAPSIQSAPRRNHRPSDRRMEWDADYDTQYERSYSTTSEESLDEDDPEWIATLNRGDTPITRQVFSWEDNRTLCSEFSRVFNMEDGY